jgi:uncharacterized protein (TIGR02145 family)
MDKTLNPKLRAKMKIYIFLLLLSSFQIFGYTQTTKIGSQNWMIQNLDAVVFRNGDTIFQAKTNKEWKNANKNKQPAWCNYNNSITNGTKYGKLYNWYAINDSRGLAPMGYHIPSDEEWSTLENYLGKDIGKKLITIFNSELENKDLNNNLNSTNSNFHLILGGFRDSNGEFYTLGERFYFWSSTKSFARLAWSRAYGIVYENFERGLARKNQGLSVRCIKD